MKRTQKILLIGLCLFLNIRTIIGAETLPTVLIEAIEKKEVFDLLVYPVRIEPRILATVLTETSGVVEELKVRIGDTVKKNQMIAKVRHLDPVYGGRSVEVKATINGVVSQVYMTEGAQVQVGERVLVLTEPNDAKIMMMVSAQDLPKLIVGQKAMLSVRGVIENHEVEIRGLSPLVDFATGTAPVELISTNPEVPLPLGAIGRVELRTQMKEGFLVARDSLFYRGEASFVRLASPEGMVSVKPVTTGRKRGGKIEILSGLNEGDWLILRSSKFLKEGAQVTISNPPAQTKDVQVSL